MLRIEMYQIGNTYRLTIVTFHDKAHLSVGIDIITRSGNIVV